MKEAWKKKLPNRKESLAFFVGIVLAAGVMNAILLIKQPPLALSYDKAGVTIPWVPDTVKRWEDPINEMGKKYNLDPNVIAIIMTLESGGYSNAVSEAGAEGLMQVTPPTARDIAKKFLKEPRNDFNYSLLDPKTGIEFGAAYLAHLRDEFASKQQAPTWIATVELIAAGYNGGPGAANRLEQGKGLTDTQTVVYSRDAFNMWRERGASKSPTFDRWVERGGSHLLEKAKSQKP